jgi:hypothetical protein
MRITRLTFLTALVLVAAVAMQSFPRAPAERAAMVCKPVLFLTNIAGEIAASMNDSGRVGPARQPWHGDAHRTCLRIAERVFVAAAES